MVMVWLYATFHQSEVHSWEVVIVCDLSAFQGSGSEKLWEKHGRPQAADVCVAGFWALLYAENCNFFC